MCLLCLLQVSALGLASEKSESETINIYVLETIDIALIQQSNATYQAELTRLLPHLTFNFITANAQGSMQKATDLLTQQLQSGPPYH